MTKLLRNLDTQENRDYWKFVDEAAADVERAAELGGGFPAFDQLNAEKGAIEALNSLRSRVSPSATGVQVRALIDEQIAEMKQRGKR